MLVTPGSLNDMFILIYGFGLLFFWIRAARMQHSSYPLMSEENFLAWKYRLRVSYRKYAALFILQIILAFIIGITGHFIHIPTGTKFNLSNMPFYFQILVYLQLFYTVVIILFTGFQAYKNYQYGKNIGVFHGK